MTRVEKLPEPPKIDQRIHLPALQWVGLALCLLIVALALARVWGPARTSRAGSLSGFEWRLEIPSRTQMGDINAIELHARNASGSARDSLTFAIDPGFLQQTADLRFEPRESAPGTITLPPTPRGGVRLARIEFQGRQIGRHGGTITIAAGSDRDTVRFHSIFFP